MNLSLPNKYKSLDPFTLILPDFVVLTGLNGAGKTQLLTAITNNHLNVIENGLELNPKKYVTGQTLAPNDSAIVTREQLNVNTQNIWNQYNDYLKNKQSNPSYSLENHVFGQNSPQIKLIERIAKSAKKQRDELTSDDFFNFYPFEDGLTPSDIFYQNFSSLFKRYQDKLDENEYREYRNKIKGHLDVSFLTKNEFTDNFGEAPWEFVNKIIKEATLDYHINSPADSHRDAPFELKLINNLTGTEVKFGDLSSGEKVIMSLALALYNSNFDIEFPKMLLMDEPDASLHPSMSKKFLDVIQEVFVKEKKMKVIVTTHSPSTLALAPEESIFIVNKTGQRVEKATKDRALKILTSGVPSFSISYENRRQVFVESPNDVAFYENLYQKVSGSLIPEISLTFISSGESRTDKNGVKVSNCGQVINITQTLRTAGNKFVFGLIDWDTVNQNSDGIFVLGNGNRYSIENYIIDPIFIAAILLREKIVDKKSLHLTDEETFTDLKHFSAERLQSIVDYITEKIKPTIKPSEETTTEVSLLNGIKITIPNWYLHHQGHELEEKIIKIFPELNGLKKGKEELLKLEILNKVIDDLQGLLSADIIDAFIKIQSH
ncbi:MULTISPECIES: AAA family ATPase [unclassified Flavobacterium]|uniref:AAA family ATPase n=1 Tax=unclassified Flavobacterium TaxID=196869 RepID=UPI003F8FD0B9